MLNWLVKRLVDSGWVRLGLAFRWFSGTKELLAGLVNESDLKVIERRYQLVEQSGFFSGEQGTSHRKIFIQALFAYDAFKADAFSKALEFSYSWNGGSVTPLAAFLNFIRRIFFQGPLAQENKQTFIEAVLTQHKGQSNALSHAAWAENPTSQAELNPFTMVLNSLTEAGCFLGPHAAKNKQSLIHAICMPNSEGENALYNALKGRSFSDKSPNVDPLSTFKELLNALVQADYFTSPSADSNKEVLINAILIAGKSGGVLRRAMWNPKALQQILTILEQLGCFAKRDKIQDFLQALTTPDCIGGNPLSYAAHIPKSLQLIYKQLKKMDCFTEVEDKQKLISAILSLNHNDEGALFNASTRKGSSTLMLRILSQAGCFDGLPGCANQQAFVKTVFTKNEYGNTCLSYPSLNDGQILKQLLKMKCFEGPFAEQNKQSFMNIVFVPKKKKEEVFLQKQCDFPHFPLLLKHLTAVGCTSSGPNRQVFLDTVFAKNQDGESLLSNIYTANSIRHLLNKLEEAHVFDDKKYRMEFLQNVYAKGNALLFRTMYSDLRPYLALHKCLKLAGCSAQDIKKLLNEPVQRKYEPWDVATPLMVALYNQYDLLAARLVSDGAELTEQQKQLVEKHLKEKKKKMVENKGQEVDREAIKKELLEPSKSLSYQKPKLVKSHSLSDLSLFAKKPPEADCKYAVDDMALLKSFRP